MIYFTVFAALVLFIYINRSLQKRREGRREKMQERREEYLQRLLATKKGTEKSDLNEVSDPGGEEQTGAKAE